MKNRQYRFHNLISLAAYIDGFVDCLRAEGKYLDDATYALGYIDMGKTVRVIAIDEKLKSDIDELPITIIDKDKLQDGELDQLVEVRLGTKGTAN